MNIVSIDSDKNHNDIVNQYFSYLDINGYSFNNFSDFYSWVNSIDKSDINTIDFLFVAVEGAEDQGFNESIALKDKLPIELSVVVFLLNQHCDKSFVKSIKYGAGYLLKPFSSDLFISTIHYHSKHTEINRLLGKKNKQLVAYKKANDREHAIVESIFANHFDQHLLKTEHIRFYISPASVFNGDVLLTEQGPSGSLYLAVGDVTGHGLPAAIGAMPVYSTFRSMAKKGMAVGAIAYEMNASLRTLLPPNMMMAITIMELDYSDGTAVIWSGGMPEVIVVDQAANIVRKVNSRHSPLSMLEPESFRQDVDVVHLQKNDRLFFYTDGIEEANSSSGEMFGTERFLSLFQGNPLFIFNRIVDTHKNFIGKRSQDDDITLVEVSYFSDLPLSPPVIEKKAAAAAVQWQMSFIITPVEIKQSDPLAQVVGFLNNSINISVHQDFISTILSELFNNALDHGLLKLDSSRKNTDEGFIDYYVDRRKRIAKMSEGKIDIEMRYQNTEENLSTLNIIVSDTGNGFDHNSLVYDHGPSSRGYGHGLQLVNDLCASVEYLNGGRTVKVVYELDFD